MAVDEARPAGRTANLRRRALQAFAGARTRVEPFMPVLRVLGFVAAAALVIYVGFRAARDFRPSELTWWPLPLALAGATVWWLMLARGWALLVSGRMTRGDVSVWCRTQALRFLPGGFWAPASRVALVRGDARDRFATVIAENLIGLCAALALGGAAFAASGRWVWVALVATLAVPIVASKLFASRTRVTPAASIRATGNYLIAFAAYALAAVLAQGAVSGFSDPLAVAGAATLAWAAGLVVVFAPSGVGVREVAYIALLAGTFPEGELAAATVTLRLATVVAELGVLLAAGRPARTAEATDGRPSAA